MRYFFAFLICAFISTNSIAQQDSLHVYFNADDQNPPAGQLDVEVYVNDWVSLVGVQIFVKWDSTVLEVVQTPFINNTDLTGPSVILPFQNNVNPERGQAKYNFFDFSGPTLMDSTHIFTLRFDVIGGPCDETTLTIGDIGTSPSQKIEITGIDSDGNLVTGVGATVNESLFAIPGTNCNAADPVGLTFPSITGNPGDNICIPLTVMNFDSIDSFGGSVNWNPNLLEYSGVQGFGVAQLAATDFSSTPGNLIFTWADLTTANPETLADGSTLFEVCFDIVGAAGSSSPISVSGTPNQLSFTMAGPTPSDPSVPLMVSPSSGSISIIPPAGASPVAFFFGNVNGSIGTNVCIPLTVNDFDNITAFSGSVNWDATVIQYTGVQAIGIGSMTIGDFMNSPGVLSYEWMNPAMPETLADGSTLFEICFDVIGAAGSSTIIDITDNPTPITLVQQGSAPGVPGFTVGSGMLSIPAPPMPGPIIFTLPTLTANVGDNICAPLTIENFEDMASIGGSVMWDQTVIQYTGTQNYGLPGLDASSINDGPAASGMLGFVWADPTPATPETLADGATLMEICFEVVGNGTSILTITDDPTAITAGYQGPDPSQPVTNLETETNEGQVTASGGGGGGDEVVFTFPDLTGNAGSNVCVPLTIENFINISSVNGSVNWDPAILTYTGLGNNNLPGFVAANFNSSNASNGQATFLWSDGTAVTPLTLPDGEFLFEVCYDVIGSDGTVSPIRVTDNPTNISVAAADPNNPAAPLMNLEFLTVDGSFTVEGDPPPPVDGVTLTIPEACHGPGTNFCIPVTVQDFNNISQLDFSLNWDPTVITFTAVGDSPLSGFNPTSMVFAGNSQNGVLTFSWFDGTAVNPNSFPNGTTIVEFCFDVIGELGDVSMINLTDMPTDIIVGQAGATPSDPVVNVPVTLENGSITVKVSDVVPFIISTSCPVVSPGQQACVDFNVANFDDLVITEFNWRWDPSELRFAEIRNIHPNASSTGNLTDIDFGFFGTDRMNIAWTGAQNPVSIPDGATYFTICYDVLLTCPSDDGAMAEVEIFADPNNSIPFVVTDDPSAMTLLDFEISNCAIELDCPVGQPLSFGGIAATLGAPGACSNTGSISQPFSGGTAPYMLTWTGGNAPTQPITVFTGPATLDNLSAGTYNLTITDAMGAAINGGPWTLSAPNPLVINPTVINVNCNNQGSITINATGGTPPYSYIGPNGNVQTHTNLGVGSYRVEVRDQDGCSDVQFVNIVDDCPPVTLTCSAVATPGMCGLGGKITATSTGGTGNVSVSYDPPVFNVCNVPTNITYTVTFRDSNGQECIRTIFVGETAPQPIQISITDIMAAQCNGVGGSAIIDIMGGCEPVICSIQQVINGQPSGSLPCSASGNLLPGEYQVTADPNFGDNVVEFFTIPGATPPSPLTCMVTDVQDAGPCFGTNGSFTITADGGCGAYRATVIESGTTGTPIVVNLNMALSYPAGSYEVAVMDATGVTCNRTVTLEGPLTPLQVIISADTCSLTAVPTGGCDLNYNYVWTLTDSIETITTAANITIEQDTLDINQSYTVVVTDDCGCDVTVSANMFCDADTTMTGGGDCMELGDVMISDLQGGMASCAGTSDCDGMVSGFIAQECHDELGGTGYSVVATDSFGNATEVIVTGPGAWSITGLCAEVYSVRVEDSAGNTFNAGVNLTVTAPDPMVVTLNSRTCSMMEDGIDQATGTLDVSISGGPVGTGYEVVWTNMSVDTIDCVFDCDMLEAGTYFITVRDDNGCEITDFFEIEACDTIPPPGDCIATPVFSPNADGMNDFFILGASCFPPNTDTELNVYDRWGRLVFNGNDYQNDWDGTDRDGQPLIEGAYHWVYIIDDGDTKRIEKGTVTLLRNRS